MNSQPVLLKQENKNNYKVYLEDILIGSIVDNLKFNFLGFKNGALCSVLLGDENYTFRYVRSVLGVFDSSFELTTSKGEKIIESKINNYYYNSTASVLFTFKKDDDTGIFLEYDRYSPALSQWKDKNKVDIANWKNNIFEYDNKVILKGSKELDCLIVSTILIEKFQIRKQKLITIYFFISSIIILSIIFFLFLFMYI